MDRRLIRIVGLVVAGLLASGVTVAEPRRDNYGGGPRAGYARAEAPARSNFGYAGPQGGGYRQPAAPYRQPPAPYPGGYPPAPRTNSLGADWRQQQEEARSGVRLGRMAPLGRVIDGIGRRSAGRPLDAGIEYQGSRAVYRVRWLTHGGRRVDYIVDAASGAILSEH